MTRVAHRTTVLVAVLSISAVVPGVWATAAPHAFYTTFPGVGPGWIHTDGPYNEHFIRDVGALYMALAVTGVYAVIRRRADVVATLAIVWIVFSVVHLAYHLPHLPGQPLLTQIGLTTSLVAVLAIAVVVAVRPGALASPPSR